MDSSTSTSDLIACSALLFRVGEHLYGCDIVDAQEIIPLRPMTRVPGAPLFVRGLINMRGTIVTVLDLGIRLDPTRSAATNGSIVLVRYRDRLVGLVVEQVADVRVLDVEPVSPSAEFRVEVRAERSAEVRNNGGIVRGVAVSNGVDDEAVVMLDLETMIRQVLLT